jgi:hypothetical protein
MAPFLFRTKLRNKEGAEEVTFGTTRNDVDISLNADQLLLNN